MRSLITVDSAQIIDCSFLTNKATRRDWNESNIWTTSDRGYQPLHSSAGIRFSFTVNKTKYEKCAIYLDKGLKDSVDQVIHSCFVLFQHETQMLTENQ